MAPQRIGDLQPSGDLLAVFEDCHQVIYANDGFLKDRIFHEITKLLVVKLTDEQRGEAASPLFRPGDGEMHPDFVKLLRLAAENQPDLIEAGREFSLSIRSLNYAISKLAPISLERSPGDVKGQAFQTFVYRNQRGDRGEYFTPHPVVRAAVEMLSPSSGSIAIDPACGSGGFLLEILHYIREKEGGDAAAEYLQTCIHGWEFNPDVARSAAVRLELEGGTGREVEVRNSLLEARHREGVFDLVATNPPFGSKGKVDDPAILEQYDLARTWKCDREGKWQSGEEAASQTPEVLFVELCVRLLKPGGQLAMVVPDGLLQNSKMGYVRQWLRQHAEISGVVSLPPETFVPYGTGIKTSLLLAERLPLPIAAERCFMSKVERVGYDAKGKPVYQRSSGGGAESLADDLPQSVQGWLKFRNGERLSTDISAFSLSRNRLNSRLDVEHYLPGDLDLIDELRAEGASTLGDHATFVTAGVNLKEQSGEIIRYIAISNLDAATMRVASQEYVRADEAPSRAKYEVKAGDILTSLAGANCGTSRHASAWVSPLEAGAVCSNGLAVLRDIDGVDPFYLLAFLRSPIFFRQVKRLRTGHAIPAVSLADLKTVLVPRASSEDQASVAARVREMFDLSDKASQIGRDLTLTFSEDPVVPPRLSS